MAAINTFDDGLSVLQRRLEAKGRSEGTVKKHSSHVRSFSEWCREDDIQLKDIDQFDIEDYFAHLHTADYAPKTIKAYHLAIRLMFDAVIRRNPDAFDGENPAVEFLDKDGTVSLPQHTATRKEKENREIPYVEPHEKEAMANNVPNPKVRNELIIRLLWQTGIRAIELNNIKLRDIDYDRHAIDIYSDKTDSTRVVFYREALQPLMDLWTDTYRASMLYADSPYLFISRRSEKFRRSSTALDIVKEAAENADVQYVLYENETTERTHYGITTHAMRHGHAVQSLKNGVNLEVLRRHLGHDKLEQTKVYLDLIDADIEDEYQVRGKGPGYESASD